MVELTDFHSHILPGVDDGSDRVETSLAMLRQEAAQGVRRVVLTPHFYPWRDTPEKFHAACGEALRALKEACGEEPELPELHLGAEVAYFRGMSESDALKGLCIENTKYILVELPMDRWNKQVCTELEDIAAKQGLTPVIAHIDRYLTPLSARRVLAPLMGLPVLLQANAGAFLRRGSAAMLRLLDAGAIRLLGSDCHDLTERAPNLGRAAEVIERKLGAAALDGLSAFAKTLLPETKA